jgi:hypothetical protein
VYSHNSSNLFTSAKKIQVFDFQRNKIAKTLPKGCWKLILGLGMGVCGRWEVGFWGGYWGCAFSLPAPKAALTN